MNNDPNDRIARSWDDNAVSWTGAVRGRALESRRLATDAAIFDAVLNTTGTRILDVGCGEGWLARRLGEAGHEVTGFDGSAALVAEAQRSGGAHFVELSYEDFVRDPHRVGRDFDVVVCNFSLLGERLAPVLEAFHQVTRPSAHLLIQTVHPFSSSDGIRYEDGWREETFQALPGEWAPMPWFFRTISSWIRALRAAGWQLYDCTEPMHPIARTPASLILDACSAHARASDTDRQLSSTGQ